MPRSSHNRSSIAAVGALYAGAGVALAAYATHAAGGTARSELQTAALFAFGHGVALAALSPARARLSGRIALSAWLLGVLLFSGSLVAKALYQWPATLAPAGGLLLIGGWLVLAFHFLRR